VESAKPRDSSSLASVARITRAPRSDMRWASEASKEMSSAHCVAAAARTPLSWWAYIGLTKESASGKLANFDT